MKFEFADQQYEIEFERQHKQRTLKKGEMGVNKDGILVTEGEIPCTFPHTTARIVYIPPEVPGVVSAGKVVFRTWTVGGHHRDNFTREDGRINALRGICKGRSLNREFKEAIWNAYFSRFTPVIEVELEDNNEPV